MIAVVSLGLAGRLIARFGARMVLLVGLGLATVGFLLLARLPADGAYVADVLPAMLVFGVAGGLTLPAVTTLAMAGATDTDAGLASGLANTTQQVGGAVGLAALATLAAAPQRRAAGRRLGRDRRARRRLPDRVRRGRRSGGRRVAGGADDGAPTPGRAVAGR